MLMKKIEISSGKITNIKSQITDSGLDILEHGKESIENTQEESFGPEQRQSTGKAIVYILDHNDQPADINTKVAIIGPGGTREIRGLTKPGILVLDKCEVGKLIIEEVIPVSNTV